MTRRSKLCGAGAALFVLINLAGAWYAARLGEGGHLMVHVALLVVGAGAYLIWRLRQQRQQSLQGAAPADARLEYLQQSVDAMALEVERIGEKQRFSDKLRVERGEAPPLNKDQ